jgi:Immunoglobulin domain
VTTAVGMQAAFFCDGTFTMPTGQDPATWRQPPLVFQWRKNGTNIANAGQRSLVIPAAVTTDAGTYSCTLTAPDKVLASGAASLTVN